MAQWSLRVRHAGGQATLSLAAGGETTWAELTQLIAEKAGVQPHAQEVLAGFPPKPVQADVAATALIASCGISNGDSLTVRESTTAAAPAAPAAPAPAAAPAATAAASNGAPPPPAAADEDTEDALLAAAIAASLQDVPGGSQQQQQQQPAQPAGIPAAQPPQRPQQPVASSANGQTPAGKGPAPTSVALPDGSCVVRRIIPSDNSCLFTAVGYVMEHDRGKAAQLRRVIADAVAADPVTFNEGFLGQENADYQKWILDKKHWGGGIELAILSKHYGRVIAAYDIQTKRCDRYGESDGYAESVMLLYDGLHYDAMAVSAFDGAPEELDVTVLRSGGADADAAERGAKRLVAACHEARQFTDIANFTLRCGVCQIGLKGEKEAVEHAKATGHTNFSEY